MSTNTVTYRHIARQRLGKHTPAGAKARNNRKSIARQRFSKHAQNNTGKYKTKFLMGFAPNLYNGKFQGSSQLLSEVERVQLKKSSIKLVVVKNWVEFWRWQSKMIEKIWQERN
jgi:hypothetical protein